VFVLVLSFQSHYKQKTEGNGGFGIEFRQLQSAASQGTARRTEQFSGAVPK
jgi:hypothetical protein